MGCDIHSFAEGADMPEVEIIIKNPGNPAARYLRAGRIGQVGEALRACILSVADQYADDPIVQRIADAVASVKAV